MDYVKLVEKINQDLYELIPDEEKDLILLIEENSLLSFESIGYAHNFLFLGFPIWCSENDERPYENEDEDIQMPLEKWLWQEITRVLNLINKFSKCLKEK